MRTKVHEKVDVVTICYSDIDSLKSAQRENPYPHTAYRDGLVFPYKIRWRGRSYGVKIIGYHQKEKVGKTLFHIFHVSTSSLAFRLRLNSETLYWILEEVSDGTAD